MHVPQHACCTVLVAIQTVVGASSACAQGRADTDRAPVIVRVLPDAPVNHDAPDLPHVEPYVTARPGHANELLAGAILASPVRDEGPWTCGIFRTINGGTSWDRHTLRMHRCIDPWLAFTEDGGALFAGIEILEDGEGSSRLHLVLYRSPDGGVSWPDPPLRLGRGYDHELIAVDRTGGPAHGTVYLVAQRTLPDSTGGSGQHIVLLRSEDHGRSFQPRAELRPSALPLRPTGLEILSTGELVITIHDRLPDEREERGARRAWSVVSDDGGRTFSEPRFVTEACGPSDGFAGYPFLAVDASRSQFRDRLYHACIRSGFDGIALAVSDDGGRSWSDPMRVDTPLESGPSHLRTPMLAVDDQGVVGVAWYDRRMDPARACQDTYFTAAVNGGRTFAEPVRISTERSCPETPGNGRTASSWPMGGDYSSLAALPGGGFHLLWADSRSGVFQLRQARLQVRN